MKRKNSFRLVHFLALIVIFTILNACGGEKVESQKMKTPIEIDGSSEDWVDYRQLFNEDWKTVYAIANNDTSLSIMIQFRENQLARKINTRGFTLWLNSEGDKERKFGIHYENRQLMDRILNDMAEGKGMPKRQNRNSEFNKTVDLSGTFSVVDEDKNLLSDIGQNGIYAEVLYDQGNYCFEYKITKDANDFEPELFNLSVESDLKVGIEIAAVSEEFKEIMEEKMSERMKSGARPSGGVGGGRMSGGMRGGMRGGGKRGGGMKKPSGGARENMMKDIDAQEIWFSVELAK